MPRQSYTGRPRPLTPVLLGINSTWMLAASVYRVIVAIQQNTLDWIPFVSFALGAVGLATLGVYAMRDRT